MSELSRRRFLSLAASSVASIPALGAIAQGPQDSTIRGVKLGVQTYSYHDVYPDGMDHTDALIQRMRENRLYSCELFAPQVEPSIFIGKPPSAAQCPNPGVGCPTGVGGSERNPFAWEFAVPAGEQLQRARQAMRDFHLSRPTQFYESIRRRFQDAGIELYTYNATLDFFQGPAAQQMGDDEIDSIFYAAKVLGVRAMNVSMRLSMLKRVVPFAAKNQIIVAVHGHSKVSDPDEISTRQTFVNAMALSPLVGVNLDIGHYAAAGEDSVAFIKEFHDRITNLHLKDRKRNQSKTEEDGANVAWGTGDTPIGAVLRLLRDQRYAIPAFIEIEHKGSQSAVKEVQIAYDYCKAELSKP